MNNVNVVIENENGKSVGVVVFGNAEIGQVVKVSLNDENGNKIIVSGVVVEIL